MYIQDVSKKKWILTGTVGSGGFGLIYFAEEQVSPSHFYKITSFHSLLVNKFIEQFRVRKGANV